MIYKYVLPFYSLSFHFLVIVLWCTKILILMKSNLAIFPFLLVFLVPYLRIHCQNQCCRDLPQCFLLRVLNLQVFLKIHFDYFHGLESLLCCQNYGNIVANSQSWRCQKTLQLMPILLLLPATAFDCDLSCSLLKFSWGPGDWTQGLHTQLHPQPFCHFETGSH